MTKQTTEELIAEARELRKHLGVTAGSVIYDLCARLEEQQATLDKLDKTADGVYVTPGMVAYHGRCRHMRNDFYPIGPVPRPLPYCCCDVCWSDDNGCGRTLHWSDVYSTINAAEAAQGGE